MAAITLVKPVLISPAGYENVQHGYATVDLAVGDLAVFTTGAPSTATCAFAKASAADACGVVLKAVKAGGTAEVAYRGEIDGYSGLTPGARFTIAAGVIDNTAPDATQVGAAAIRAISATAIRFDLI
ncbi:MAG: hypothetical protein WBA46_15860 [Thermomicrobiales bacterium]